MSLQRKSAKLPPLDLSKWRKVPTRLIIMGAVLMAIGLIASIVKHDGGRQFRSETQICQAAAAGSFQMAESPDAVDHHGRGSDGDRFDRQHRQARWWASV